MASPKTQGPTSFNFPGKTKYGTVGCAVPGVRVELADGNDQDGREIIVKGRNVFLGYYKDQEATDATLVDGWLHSGDLGKMIPMGSSPSSAERRKSSSPRVGRISHLKISRRH